MKLLIFSVFDEKAKAFGKPMLMPHKGEAIRAFQDIVTNKETLLAKHPEDYKLYNLGTFDNESGQMESNELPEFMNNATDFLETA